GGDTQGALVVMNGPDPSFNGGIDAFVACVAASGQALEYSGYVGGALVERGTDVAVTPSGTAFLVGITTSDETTFPVRNGPGLKYGGSGVDAEDPFGVSIVFTHLTMGGSTSIGQTATFNASASDSAGLPCQFGSSLGTGPIPIDSRQIDLSPDGLLAVSVGGWWPSVFSGYRGVMNATGQAQAAIHIPNVAALIGVPLHSAFVTLDPQAPSGIRSISNTFSFQITK
ncbi:MAG: hypothetical protein JXQ29_01160, partial [Planctomycetes bacterium]|nr:hypothetical protein [Planctomycetota bacterium]